MMAERADGWRISAEDKDRSRRFAPSNIVVITASTFLSCSTCWGMGFAPSEEPTSARSPKRSEAGRKEQVGILKELLENFLVTGARGKVSLLFPAGRSIKRILDGA